MTLVERQYTYTVLTVSLKGNTVSSPIAQGLTKKINSITVISLGGGSLSVILNSSSNKLISLADNMKIEGTPMTELYWSHASQNVSASIYAVWID